jgi:predicted O-linked N-acetylglucosamine transferase (SPINDLY family)
MHAVSLLTVELFEKHDRSKFEIHAFCWSPEDGTPFRKRVKSAFDHFHPIGTLSDDDAADLIQSHEIDILFDLQGLSGRARPNLIAQGPAPIQIAYLGFPGTTCLPHVDYVIADEFLFPEALKPHFSEEPIYLDTVFQVSDSQRQFGPERSREFYGLPEDKFVFCSFNNAYKYTPEMITLWAEILGETPHSVLWLLEDNQWSKKNILSEFERLGVSADRIIFAGRIDPRDYLTRFKAADLFLDTSPYNAGTTANDALFAGLPVLTLAGQTYVSRMAGALLHKLSLDDLIAYDSASYNSKAIALARSPDRLAEIKKAISLNRPAAFDTQKIARNIEDKLIKLIN